MTREEAIKRFETLLLHVDTDCVMGMETTEAINMAIKALEQPEPCEDAVSKETLINFIKNASVWVTYKKGDSEDEAEFAENIIKQTKQAIISMIELDLPPVMPKQRTGKWIPSDSQCGIRCSVCGVPVDDFCHSIDYIDLDYEPNFCPNCGWAMKGANDANTKI